MPKTHFDQLVKGEVFLCPPFSFTEAEILSFCREYDPQYFHTDAEAAQNSPFGGLIASGWQTGARIIQMLGRHHFHFPGGMVGLGLEYLRWKAPVRPGDLLTVRATLLDKRPSASQPGRGILLLESLLENQDGQRVLEMQTSILIPAPVQP